MIIVRDRFQIFRNLCVSLLNHIRGQISRFYEFEEQEAYQCCRNRGQQGVDNGVQKNPPGVFPRAELRQRRRYRKGYRGHRDKLEQPGVNGGDEIEKLIQPSAAERAQDSSQHQCRYPERKLSAVESGFPCFISHEPPLVC